MNRVSRTTPSYHYRQSCFLKHLIQIGRNQSERARLDLKNLPALCAQIRSFAPLPRTANFRLIPGCKDRRKMMPRKIGYARVSALHQSLDRQIAALRAEGCDRIFRERHLASPPRGVPSSTKPLMRWAQASSLDASPSCLPFRETRSVGGLAAGEQIQDLARSYKVSRWTNTRLAAPTRS
jgi:hypothetical protein